MSYCKNTDVWKTIDDVTATLDSLSLINRGKRTTPRITQSDLDQRNPVNHIVNNLAEDKEDSEDETSSEFTDRRKCLQGLNERDMTAEKDAIIQAELHELWSCNFSNEAIEKHWGSKDIVYDLSGISSTLSEDEELIEIDKCIKYSPVHDQHLLELESSDTFEARVCSPPLLDENQSSTKSTDSPLSGIITNHNPLKNSVTKLLEDNPSKELDEASGITALDGALEQLATNDEETSTSKTKSTFRPKKCRNALLNSLNKKVNLEKLRNESDERVVLKTPSDFLVLNENNNSIPNNSWNNLKGNETVGSYSCVAKQKVGNKLFDSCDRGFFEYREDDFPAL